MRVTNLIKALVIPAVVMGVFCVDSPVHAEQQFEYSPQFEYREYIVKPGDTLWSISRRELEDGFQWPIIWRENLKINNPDQISPGQIIIIPVRVLEPAEIKPEAVVIEPGQSEIVAREIEMPDAGPPPEEQPAMEEIVPEEIKGATMVKEVERRPAEPLVAEDLLLAAGYITRALPDAGEVEGHAINRMAYAEGDLIYVKTRERSRPGEKFYIVRDDAEVRHPVTKKYYGRLVKVVGVAVLEEAGRTGLKARVIRSYDMIEPGDRLDYYYDMPRPFIIGSPRTPRVDGYVIAANYMRKINATFDIVFIDKGNEDGLRDGDVLMTLYPGTDDMMASVIQVVNARKETSLAVILKSVSEVTTGDVFTGIQ